MTWRAREERHADQRIPEQQQCAGPHRDNAPMFPIIKGAPIPKFAERMERFPFAAMEIGDSFVVPADAARAVKVAASKQAVRSGKRFTTRKLPDARVQVWRVS